MTEQWDFTLADFPEIARQYLVSGTDVTPTAMVYAPCCQRRTPADTVIDVRAVKGTIVAGGGIFPPQDHDWLCDGCQHRMVLDRRNAWTRSALLEARNAPASLVAIHRAWEWTEDAVRAEHRRLENRPDDERAIRPGDIHAQITEQIHALHRRQSEEQAYAE